MEKSPLLYLCDLIDNTFPAVTTYLDGGGGEWGALFSGIFWDFVLCLWCNVGSAIGMESINQFSIQIF